MFNYHDDAYFVFYSFTHVTITCLLQLMSYHPPAGILNFDDYNTMYSTYLHVCVVKSLFKELFSKLFSAEQLD